MADSHTSPALRFPHVVRAVFDEPWAIMPAKLQAIAEVVEFHLAGGRHTSADLADLVGDRRQARFAEPLIHAAHMPEMSFADFDAAAPRSADSPNGEVVAVLPVYGVMRQRVGPMEESSGMVSTQMMRRQLAALANDDRIGAIVLDIDSPGGSVFGCEELAADVLAIRAEKPVVAVANSMAASAAYWLASSAGELVVTPSGQIGSVGVYAIHEDISEMAKMKGVAVTLVSAGKYKTEGNEFEPLDDEAEAAIQKQIDGYYDAFVKGVATGRQVKASEVRGGFGEGRVVSATEARRLGMADRVGTLEETIARLMTKRGRAAVMRASEEPTPIAGTDWGSRSPGAIAEPDDDLQERVNRLESALIGAGGTDDTTPPPAADDAPAEMPAMDTDALGTALAAQLREAI